MLAGPALVGALYRLQVGKPVILHSIPNRGKGFFFSFQECPDLFCGPPNFLFSGNWGPVPGVQPPLGDADNSHPSNVKIKKVRCNILFSILKMKLKGPSVTTARYVSKLSSIISQHLVTLIITVVRTLLYIPLLNVKIPGTKNSSDLAPKFWAPKNCIICFTNKFNFPIPNIINKNYLNIWVRSKQVHSP